MHAQLTRLKKPSVNLRPIPPCLEIEQTLHVFLDIHRELPGDHAAGRSLTAELLLST